MRTARLQDMTRGWFVGDFAPTLHATRDVEVAVKQYKAGEAESRHYHKIAREFTVITSGTVRMEGKTFTVGDIIIIEPGEATDFQAVTDAVTTVVKIPFVKDDKYLA